MTELLFRNSINDKPGEFFDRDWVKSTFIITESDIQDNGEMQQYANWIRKNRYMTSADNKFSSTSPGMSMAVNPKPQFTRYCDIRSKGRIRERPDITPGTTSHPVGLGMGGYYSQAIDDNQQRVFFRFGVPQYIPLPLWINKSFDIDKAILHGRGVITSTFLEAVGLVAKIFAVAAAPLLAVGMFALSVVVANTRFYSIRETMYTYWATVENTLNQLVARRTMLPYVLQDYTYKLGQPVGNTQGVTESFVAALSSYIPDIIDSETGRISVFAIALRAQAALNSLKRQELDQGSTESIQGATADMQDYQITSNLTQSNLTSGGKTFIDKLFKKAHETMMGGKDSQLEGLDENTMSQTSIIGYDPMFTDDEGNPIDVSLDPNNPQDSLDNKLMSNANKKADTLKKYAEYALAELSEGAAFAVFNVENSGSIGESFSSSFGANPIESTFNALSAKARNITSLLSSATEVPIIGDAMKLAADAGATLLSNASFGLANPLLALAYGVNVTMPKVWESSSATLPQANYKIKLISPYGNAYSQLFNIYLPMSMLLAGSLPRSTGASSYAAPFFCQCFDRGRTNIHLGMINNLQLTRGTSNLAFTRAGHPNAIDVDLSVANLDEIVAMDVSSNGVLTKAMSNLSPNFSDSPLTTYLNSVAAVDVYTQVYRIPMLRLKLAERMMNLKSIVNPDPAAFAAMTVNTIPFGGAMKNLLGDSASVLSSLSRL